jgi:hypothetical protein
LSYIFGLKDTPPYLVSLDDDDMFELTALEKVAWMLESNQEWALGGFRYIKYGVGANETVTTGLHSGQDNFIYVSSVLESSCGCRR